MKSVLLSCGIILYSLCIQAQITVTSAIFPAAGDTLRYAQVSSPSLSNALTPPGGNQLWDFSELVANETSEEIYRPASAGQHAANFPGAELNLVTPVGEQYFNVTNNKFELMGEVSNTLLGFDFSVLIKNNPPITERHAPLNFFDIFQQTSNQLLPFDLEDLPLSLKNAIVSVAPGTDSIRIRMNQNVLDVVDGWGTVAVPGPMPRPQYPVLRQKRTEYHTRNLDIKINPIGWIDVSSLIGSGNPFGLASFLGTDTIVTHHFISNEAKEEIAVITLNTDQSSVKSIRYKNNGSSTSTTYNPIGSDITFRAYPNPAIEWMCFEGSNLPAKRYSLKIFDSVGRVVWQNNYDLEGNESISLEIGNLSKGMYFYRLQDLKGPFKISDQFVVVKK